MKRNFYPYLLISVGLHIAGLLPILTTYGGAEQNNSIRFSHARTPGGSPVSLHIASDTSGVKHTTRERLNENREQDSGHDNFNSDALLKLNRKIQNGIEYPPLARRMRWQGLVKISARLAPSGGVLEAKISASSKHNILDRAALDAVRGYRFPVDVKENNIELSFLFRLRKKN